MSGDAKTTGADGGKPQVAVTVPTRYHDDVTVGESLPELAIPLTRTVIVATAIATRDYQDVHHDPELAQQRGSDDIFMNILTTNGFVGRFVTDWAGPAAVLEEVSIRLGAPNFPGDTMTLTGTVSEVDDPATRGDGRGSLTVRVRGSNAKGDHVTGTVRLALPVRGRLVDVLPSTPSAAAAAGAVAP